MIYEDRNDSILPYDLPDDGNVGGDLPEEKVKANNNIEASNIEELSFEPMPQENRPSEEDSGSIDDIEYIKAVQKKSGSGLILSVVIVLSLVLVAGALTVIYADTLNIPYLSDVVSSLKNGSSNKVVDVDVSKMTLPSMPGENSTGNEEVDEDLKNLLGDTSEETGLEFTRNNTGSGPNMVPPGVDTGNGMPSGTGNYPPLPNNNSQLGNSDINQQYPNVVQPYSRNIGRLDPFNPSGEDNQMYDIIVPPTNPTEDEKAKQLMALKISGIMYSADSPSAIINIAGSDQLVRKGDKFNGFSVEKITKDKVTVRAGKNVYTAAVGEILNIESVGVNAIPNLNKKFAGPYSKGKDRIIEINMLE